VLLDVNKVSNAKGRAAAIPASNGITEALHGRVLVLLNFDVMRGDQLALDGDVHTLTFDAWGHAAWVFVAGLKRAEATLLGNVFVTATVPAH
jgi:hypothetical protein